MKSVINASLYFFQQTGAFSIVTPLEQRNFINNVAREEISPIYHNDFNSI